MFSVPTLFVIGAGASYELDLPLGGELLFRVAKSLDRRKSDFLTDFFNGYAMENSDRAKFSDAAALLANTLPSSAFKSIDDGLNWFWDDHRAITIGKIGIAHELLKAERESVLLLGDGSPAPLEAAEKSWLPNFFQTLIAGARRENAVSHLTSNVKIVNFNYDRTIEEYLWRALQERAALTSEIATEIVNKLEIIRPYGKLGELRGNSASSISYGQPDGYDLIEVSKGILTLAEQRHDDVATKIKDASTWARVVIFLGSAFHKQNMEVLMPHKSSRRHIFATTHGMSDYNKDSLEIMLRGKLYADEGSRVLLGQFTAKAFFEIMGPSLNSMI